MSPKTESEGHWTQIGNCACSGLGTRMKNRDKRKLVCNNYCYKYIWAFFYWRWEDTQTVQVHEFCIWRQTELMHDEPQTACCQLWVCIRMCSWWNVLNCFYCKAVTFVEYVLHWSIWELFCPNDLRQLCYFKWLIYPLVCIFLNWWHPGFVTIILT